MEMVWAVLAYLFAQYRQTHILRISGSRADIGTAPDIASGGSHNPTICAKDGRVC